VAGNEAVLPIDSDRSRANSWHTDVTFVDRIPSISILRAITLPAYGGTTVWATTVRAYETLPRLLHRITLAGDVPVGIDGRRSQVRKGDASAFSPVQDPVGVS
jgi:alpha-ketoglutarate-dependent taurine dioxygenase